MNWNFARRLWAIWAVQVGPIRPIGVFLFFVAANSENKITIGPGNFFCDSWMTTDDLPFPANILYIISNLQLPSSLVFFTPSLLFSQ